MTTRSAFIISMLTMVATPAFSADETPPADAGGLYVSTMIGGPLTTHQDFDDVSGPGTYSPDWGLGGQVELGRHMSNVWRIGLGLGWTRGFDGDLTLDGFGVKIPLDGHTDVYTAMLHTYHTVGSFPTHFGPLDMFVGAGLGVAYYDVEDFGLGGPGDKTDTAFVAALHIGYDVELQPGIALTSRYSLAYTGEAEFDQAPAGKTVKETEFDFIAMTGIRFDLN